MGASVVAGTKLGKYEIVKHLATGGMAELMIARTQGLVGFERHVVIKRIRDDHEDRVFVDMFLNEASLAALLHHHNIVQVLDIGEEDGKPYFAMEYVHGEDLRKLLYAAFQRKEPVPLEHVVSIITTIAVALHHAHEQRSADGRALEIVHRDVTPGNILVGYDGNVKVVDFGIAKAAMRKVITQAGMRKGKAPYMSPEQCRAAAVDRRSDVFALGIVLHETATLRRLFKGPNEFSTMSAVVSGNIPRPRSLRADIPVELEAITMRALERDPAARYQTAEEMVRALEKFAATAGLRSTPTSLSDYMKRLFGSKQEPWQVDNVPEATVGIDFDDTVVGAPPEAPPALPESQGTNTDVTPIAEVAVLPAKKPLPRPSVPKTPPKGKPALPSVLAKTADEPSASQSIAKVAGGPPSAPPPPPPSPSPSPSPSKGDVATVAEPLASASITKVDVATAVEPPGAEDRAATDHDESTDVTAPPPPPRRPPVSAEIHATTAAGDTTAIVKPLPSPLVTDAPREKRPTTPPDEKVRISEAEVDTAPIALAPRRPKYLIAIAGVATVAVLLIVVFTIGFGGGGSGDDTATTAAPPPVAKPRVAAPEPTADEAPRTPRTWANSEKPPEIANPTPPPTEPAPNAVAPDPVVAAPPPEPTPVAVEPVKTPEPAPVAVEPVKAPEPTPVAVEPVKAPESTPAAVEPTPTPVPKVKPAPTPKAKPAPKPVAVATKRPQPQPQPTKKPVAKPTKPAPAPKWDPNSLFPRKK